MKIRRLLISVFGMTSIYSSVCQVGVGTTSPHQSSILEVNSNSKGFLIPRMNKNSMNLINSPTEGLMVYCTDCCTDGGRLAFFTDSWTLAIPCPNIAPIVTNPSISGTPTEGEVLTANFSYSDTEGDVAGNHTYKWYRSDNVNGLNRTLITGAVSSTYTLQASDVNKFIQFSVVPYAQTGTSPGLEVTSGYSGVIQPFVPNVVVIPPGNFTSGGNKPGGAAHHPTDVDYGSLFDGFTQTGNSRFHEGDYIDIDFSTPSVPVVLPAGSTIEVYWYHNSQSNYWGVFATFYNGNAVVDTKENGPFNTEANNILILTSTGAATSIRVGAIENSITEGGYDARIREIIIKKPDGTIIDITVQ